MKKVNKAVNHIFIANWVGHVADEVAVSKRFGCTVVLRLQASHENVVGVL